MTHPLGLIYEVLLIVEKLGIRYGLRGHVAILVTRDIALNPSITVDFIKEDKSFFRFVIAVTESHLISGVYLSGIKDTIVRKFEAQFKGEKHEPLPGTP